MPVRLRSADMPEGYDPAAFRWRGIGPDGTPDQQMLEQLTSAIVQAVEPERIILFGSAARGEMRADSDLDVLVVKDGRLSGRCPGRLYVRARGYPGRRCRRGHERGHRATS